MIINQVMQESYANVLLDLNLVVRVAACTHSVGCVVDGQVFSSADKFGQDDSHG
jgi:hypothetical protein